MPRIGVLISPSPRAVHANIEAWKQGLHALGYIEGQNIAIEYRSAEGKAERLPDLAAELVRLPVDVIVTGGSYGIRAAPRATRTIPIVMAGTTDAVVQGFVASLARPGGNITGLSDLSIELPGKRIEILKKTIPQSTHIAVLADPTSPYHASIVEGLTAAAQTLGLKLHLVMVRHEGELDAAFAAITHAGANALVVSEGTPLLLGLLRRIVDLAARYRLPAIYDRKQTVAAGGLMSYGTNIAENWRRAAVYMDKILKGALPGDLPVEQSTTFELVINLKTAKALDLTIPPTILFQATKVIE